MKKTIALFLAFCLSLSGCGADGGDATSENGASVNDVQDSVENIGASGGNDRTDTDEGGGSDPEESSGADFEESSRIPADTSLRLYLQERQSIAFAETEEGYQPTGVYYDIMDGCFYLFRKEEPAGESAGQENQRICVQVYDSKSQTLEQHILTPEIPGHEKYEIRSVGLTAEGDVSLKLSDTGAVAGNGDAASLFLVKTDLQGNVLEVVEPFPDEAKYPWNAEDSFKKRVFHLPDGRTVLCEGGSDGYTADLFWFKGESVQRFGQLEAGLPSAFSCDSDGLLYYVAGGVLYGWDLEKDTLYELFRLEENGVSYNYFNLGLIVSGEGDILLCSHDQEELSIYVLSDQRVVNDEEIRVVSLRGSVAMQYISRKASTYSYDTGGLPVSIEAEDNEAYQEDYRNRIVAELTAGKGPDILLLTEDDLRLLSENGYLCDLSDMIPEDTKAEMIPSVLEMGTLDGKLVGITPQVEFATMVTSTQTWEKDRWSVDEFLELAQSRDDWETLASFWNSNMGYYMLFYNMFGDGMLNSDLLDLEQGVSRLDSDKFLEILEICKKYGEKEVNFEKDEINALLKEGKIAAHYVTIYGIADFSTVMNRYGDDIHFVGFPVPDGVGSFVHPYSFFYLAVNANSSHKEECRRFITYLLSYENQFSVDYGSCCVRLDVIRDSIISKDYLDENNQLHHSYMVKRDPDATDGGMWLTDDYLKPDGTPWLEEYIDFIKNTQPQPFIPSQITRIMGSELKAYFEEGRSARDVADNLQNRVQLYLDETK